MCWHVYLKIAFRAKLACSLHIILSFSNGGVFLDICKFSTKHTRFQYCSCIGFEITFFFGFHIMPLSFCLVMVRRIYCNVVSLYYDITCQKRQASPFHQICTKAGIFYTTRFLCISWIVFCVTDTTGWMRQCDNPFMVSFGFCAAFPQFLHTFFYVIFSCGS